jgi:hypothetical protein
MPSRLYVFEAAPDNLAQRAEILTGNNCSEYIHNFDYCSEYIFMVKRYFLCQIHS